MVKRIEAVLSLIVAILIISSLTGLISYYISVIDDKNSEIATLSTEVSDLRNQMIELSSAKIEASLKVQEFEHEFPPDLNSSPLPVKYDCLVISGSAINTRQGTAFNAGLNVSAQDVNGKLLVNMTVPLGQYAPFAPNAEIKSWLNSVSLGYGFPELSNLYRQQSKEILIYIFHEGIAFNWTVTPVWTNFSS